MPDEPVVKFLSLFVPDLEAARKNYASVFGLEPLAQDDTCLHPHPFAAAGPVVFDLGSIKLALYQCDMKATHPGDVGIGVSARPDAIAKRARSVGANVFLPPRQLPNDSRKLAVFMMPDRHFFEAIGSSE